MPNVINIRRVVVVTVVEARHIEESQCCWLSLLKIWKNLDMENEEDSLTKVYIDLPNHWGTGGESMWALSLGADLYEIRNTPFFAYGINWGDIVRAYSDDPDLKPEVREVVKRSGHKTLRIIFNNELEEEAQQSCLSSLENMDLSWERMNDIYLAIDIHPEANYDAVCSKLAELEDQGILEYETCEARVPGSFDDVSSNDE